MRLIDADALIENYNLKDAKKYGNKDAEQQAHSYSTLMLYEVADMIEDAPTVEAVLKWIPCSERLPEEPEENQVFENKRLQLYLVSCKGADYPFRAFWTGKVFTDGWSKLKNVTAWMPLPGLYKEVKHDQTD